MRCFIVDATLIIKKQKKARRIQKIYPSGLYLQDYTVALQDPAINKTAEYLSVILTAAQHSLRTVL